MRLETIPVIIGGLFALFGLWVAVDAWTPDRTDIQSERRRRARAERSRPGQVAVALGLFAIAAALIGRDGWRYGTLSVIAGGVLLLIGAILNRRFLYESFAFRGAARRSGDGFPPPPEGTRPPGQRVTTQPVERRKTPRE